MTDSEVEIVLDIEDTVPAACREYLSKKPGKQGCTTAPDPVFASEERCKVRGLMLSWYRSNRRKLPWRGDAPPYGQSSVDKDVAITTKSLPPVKDRVECLKEEIMIATGAAAVGITPLPSAEMPLPAASSSGRLNNAYGTWVSEIMLQQTRVETVIDYYNRWMTRFPTVEALASASQEDVFKEWAGLGYYRRATNLLNGAKQVMSEFEGKIPSNVPQLKSISGIGDYTAGAIASIAFNEPVPLVDGNVIRVISRLRAWPVDAKSPALAKDCWRAAAELVDPESPGDFNQSLMELGATVCLPAAPKCAVCPLYASGACKALEVATAKSKAGTLAPAATPPPAKKSRSKTSAPSASATQSLLTFFPKASTATSVLPPVAVTLPNNFEAICQFIGDNYPARPKPKETVTQQVFAALITVSDPLTAQQHLLLLKEHEKAATAGKRKRSDKVADEGSQFLAGSLLSGQWHPIISVHSEEAVDIDAIAVLTQAAMRTGLQPIGLPAPLGDAQDFHPSEGALPISVSKCDKWEGVKHVFSHRTHLMTVYKWQLDFAGANMVDITKQIEQRAPGVEARFIPFEEIEAAGITTWLRKMLNAAEIVGKSGDK